MVSPGQVVRNRRFPVLREFLRWFPEYTRQACALLCGAAWALGLGRVLALDLHIELFYRVPGIALLVLAGGLLALVMDRTLTRCVADGPPSVAYLMVLLLPLVDVLSGDYQSWRGPVLVIGAILVSAAVILRASTWRWFLLSILVPLVVYLPDISPYVGRADTFEFQVVGPQLGIAHPSGYPLYTLVCKLFSLLPFGTVAWRINLSSAVFASLATGFVFLTLDAGGDGPAPRRLRPIAFFAAMILAFSPTLWSRAIEAEVYALNAFLVALFLWLAVRWHTGAVAPDRVWPVFGLLVGVAMASHVTLGALGAIAAAGLLSARLRPGARAWRRAVGFGLLGLALYAYIPLRWPAVTAGTWMSPVAFWRFVTNADSGGALHPWAFYQDPARWGLVWERLIAQVGWAGLALAVVGLVRLAWRRPTLALGTFLAFAAWVWFNLSFYVADPDYSAFLIPAHVLLVSWLGQGAQTVFEIISGGWGAWQGLVTPRSADGTGGPVRSGFCVISHGAAVTLLAWVTLSRLWLTGPSLDTVTVGRNDELWARYALSLPLADGAAILADSEKFPPLYYLQQVAGVRPDLEMVTLFSEQQYRADLETRLQAGQPVYLARYLPGMDGLGVSSVGPLVAVGAVSQRLTDSVSGIGFGDALVLHAHKLLPDPEGRALHHLTLTWQVVTKPVADLEIRLRLVDPLEERVVWASDAARPVTGYTSTAAWQAGQEIDDYHALAWPAWLPAGSYQLELGVFPRFSEQGLPVEGADQVWMALDSVDIPGQAAVSPLQRQTLLYGGRAWLVGVDAPAEATSGGVLTMDLAWVCASAARSLPDIQMRWVHLDSGDVTLASPRAVDTGSPFDFCAEAIPMPALRRYAVAVPALPGPYCLELGSGDGPAGVAAVQCGWLRGDTAACELADVVVRSGDESLASYNGQIALVDATVEAAAVPAGGQLAVDLVWRALRSSDRNYTVFVQVIGPDGQLYGQVDSWPVQGTHPTAAWEVGEIVTDPYLLYVDTDGPAGEYRVIVGWYLLADMTRLPVVDSSGRQIGDSYEVGRFALR